MDTLAAAVNAANSRHAALLRSGTERQICEAYIAALEAEHALLVDSDDTESAAEIAYQLEDERAALAEVS